MTFGLSSKRPLRRTAQNFAFFFTLPPPFRSFSLSECLLVEFWPPGFHTTAREPKRAHLRVPALQTKTKFHEKTPRERQKERKWAREREKKRETLGSPTFGPRLRGPTSRPLPLRGPTMTPDPKLDWPKLDWPKIGLAQVGLAKIGHISTKRDWPKSVSPTDTPCRDDNMLLLSPFVNQVKSFPEIFSTIQIALLRKEKDGYWKSGCKKMWCRS